MYSAEAAGRALRLRREGWSLSQIQRETGIARATIRRWEAEGIPNHGQRRRGSCLRCESYRFPVPGLTEFAYSQLFGLYLGDGCISSHPKDVFRLRIALDRAYPAIVEECAALIAIVMPENKVSVIRRADCRVDEPSADSRHWPCLFPQHGPGVKHHRPIRLESWQREIVDAYPWRFLRGLIQSDGYRGMNTIRHPKKTYAYPRYAFSNRSDDIRGLFCEYCDLVGVEWRRMNRWTISVARRESVALMDRHIGPKH